MNGPFNARTVLDIRGKFYTLLATTIPPEIIMATVCYELVRCCGPATEMIWNIASSYDVLLKRCQKDIFALEAFAAR